LATGKATAAPINSALKNDRLPNMITALRWLTRSTAWRLGALALPLRHALPAIY